MIVIRYNPNSKRYFLKEGATILGTKNGYEDKEAAEKARLRITLSTPENPTKVHRA